MTTSGACVSEIRGDSVDSGAVDAAVPGIAGNEYRGPSRPTASTGTSRRIQMADAYPSQNSHPCAIDGCTRATLERRCAEHQAQLERNLAQLARENTLATCTCPYCDVPPRIDDPQPAGGAR